LKIQFVKNKRNIPLAADFLIKSSRCLHCLSFCHRESILVLCCNGFRVNPFLGELLNLSVQCLIQKLAKANLVFWEKFTGTSTSDTLCPVHRLRGSTVRVYYRYFAVVDYVRRISRTMMYFRFLNANRRKIWMQLQSSL